MSAQPLDHTSIEWLGDSDMTLVLQSPRQCRNLFGQPELLRELQQLMRQNPSMSHWYRPAGVLFHGQWVAAGGFKGIPQKDCAEIGYRVHPDFRRQGHASRLVRWLCHQGEQHSLQWIMALTDRNNIGSQRVLAQNGFVHTADLLSDRQHWLQRWQYRVRPGAMIQSEGRERNG